ncbi:MAG: hypothetical protein RIM23_02280 [Coleofasciculus sp. G3-WIS-01]|uniref:hypothetical protein n=1 Tax=Coleofasciculus sp. G3-WIS-01 TaxID=3069528 RepID=UPI0032FAABB1
MQCLKPEYQAQALELLQQAVSIAERLNESRAQSFAVGKLGHFYECRQDYEGEVDKPKTIQNKK